MTRTTLVALAAVGMLGMLAILAVPAPAVEAADPAFKAAAECRIRTARENAMVASVRLDNAAFADPQPPGMSPARQRSPVLRREVDDISFDRQEFKRSAQSVLRGDLLACRNLDAPLTRLRDFDFERFAKTLNGVWINENTRTVHGQVVETDAAFYIQMQGMKGVGLLIDRNNTGEMTLTRPFADPTEWRVERPLTWSFVNCRLNFVDKYVKVSDTMVLAPLAQGTRVSLEGVESLEEAWKRIVAAGYFDSFESKVSGLSGKRTQKVKALLGDETRFAVLDNGGRVTEKQIHQGLAPGAEYELPMITGGLFQIELRKAPQAEGQPVAADMNWLAEYRGVGIGIPPGEAVPGFEEGRFVQEGDAFLAPTGSAQWTTSDCGDKNGLATPTLTFERVILDGPSTF